jgi:lipopolysaccharide biosynthesis regulator YciM
LLRELTRQYREKNDLAKRKEVLEKVVSNDPKNRELSFDLADLYFSERDYEKSAEILQRLVCGGSE